MKLFSGDFGRPANSPSLGMSANSFMAWFNRFLSRCYDLFRAIDEDLSKQTWEDVQGLLISNVSATLDTTRLCYSFASGASNVMQFAYRVPHRWIEGTTVKLHMCAWCDSAPGASNVSKWQIDYVVYDENGTVPDLSVGGNWTSVTTTCTHNASARVTQAFDLASITMASKKISAIVKAKITRLGADAADTAPVVYVDHFMLHAQGAKDGSGDPYAK